MGGLHYLGVRTRLFSHLKRRKASGQVFPRLPLTSDRARHNRGYQQIRKRAVTLKPRSQDSAAIRQAINAQKQCLIRQFGRRHPEAGHLVEIKE